MRFRGTAVYAPTVPSLVLFCSAPTLVMPSSGPTGSACLCAVDLIAALAFAHLGDHLSGFDAQLLGPCRFNPTGCKTRHCGSASEQDHDRRAAAAAPLQQVITQREREVSAVVRAKAIYAKFISFRNTLLRTVVDAGARARAVDPREAEPQLQSPVAVHGHETVSVNVHLVPGLKPLWGPEHPRRCPVGPCSEIPGSVDVRDLPGAVRELMVPYAHLPASILQRCGSEVDGIEAEQEAAERHQVMVASNERAEEVAAGLAERGLDALVFAVGSQDAQEEWADQHRIRMGSPKDFSDDAMARAVKCVGGHLRARLEVEGGLSDLMGRRIDIFLPVYVQWVAARVKKVDGAHATVRFWYVYLAALLLLCSLLQERDDLCDLQERTHQLCEATRLPCGMEAFTVSKHA